MSENKEQYTIYESAHRIRDLDIEPAEIEYTKDDLLRELKRRRIKTTQRQLTFHISRGLIDPPRRQAGKRGRPGIYNGSIVIVLNWTAELDK